MSPAVIAVHQPQQEPDYPWGDTWPAPGRTLEVAPGVRWLRMALPFALNHVNLWLLRDEVEGPHGVQQGWTVVDCGIADEATRAAWEQVFATELDGLPVLRVVVTHMHPDHVGLAHWLTQRWSRAATDAAPGFDCRLWMSATDFAVAHLGSRADAVMGGEAAAAFAASHGLVDAHAVAQIRARAGYYASMVPQVPATYRRLMDGERLPIGSAQAGGRHAWHARVGHGHAPEHIALHSPTQGVLLAGDMLLPRISTNVSVDHREPDADPLALFLASLERLRDLPADTLVLPSHGKPFRGLHARIDQLHRHHADRLADVMTACTQAPCTAAELLPVLFKRPLDLHQTTFALGEAVAHLNALWHQGRLQRHCEQGVYRYAPAAA